MPLATTQGRAAALDALKLRRALPPLAADANSLLPAGAPMAYSCRTCHAVIVVPEDWIVRPYYCAECQALIDLGWME